MSVAFTVQSELMVEKVKVGNMDQTHVLLEAKATTVSFGRI